MKECFTFFRFGGRSGNGEVLTNLPGMGKALPGCRTLLTKPLSHRWLMVLLVMLGFSFTVQSQVVELNTFLQEKSSSEESAVVDEGARLHSLVYDLHSTFYVNPTGVKKAGNGNAVVARVDAGSLARLYSAIPESQDVELLWLDINTPEELNSVIDLGQVSFKDNLKYLLVMFAYDACGDASTDCFESLLKNMVPGEYPQTLLYLLSIPE